MSGLLYDTGKDSDIHFYKHTDKGMVRCESRHFPFFSFYILLIAGLCNRIILSSFDNCL